MSSDGKPADTPAALRWTVHPPERRHRTSSLNLPCACCCCCCCCLHSLGSLIGGVVGSVKQLNLSPRELDDPDFPFPFRRDELEEEGAILPAGVLYWLILSFLLGVGAVWYYFTTRSGQLEDLLTGLVIGLCLLPIPQLGASILSAIVVSLCYADRRAALARIGSITQYSFIGTIIGLALLGCFCVFFGLLR
jgi:hypothetical protein